MFRKAMLNWIGCIVSQFLPVVLFSGQLTPQLPVAITSDGSVDTAVSVVGTAVGFMTVWVNTSTEVTSDFSSTQGSSWNPPVQVSSNNMDASICGRGDQFLINWIVFPGGGFMGPILNTSISTDQGQTWSAPVPISPNLNDPGGNPNTFAATIATDAGFMAIWISQDFPATLWSNFSIDGTTWGSPLQILVGSRPGSAVSVAGTTAGFLASWKDFGSSEGNAIFSHDQGVSWSLPVLVAENMETSCSLSVYGTNSGFMATWLDSAGNIWANFSADNGLTWNGATLISTNAYVNGSPMISGTDAGFVVTWVDINANAYASFSSDKGVNWSNPAQITTSEDVFSSVSVSAIGTDCLFTWNDFASNAYSSFSPYPVPQPLSSPSNGASSGGFWPCHGMNSRTKGLN